MVLLLIFLQLKNKSIKEITNHISTWSILIPALLGCIFYNKLQRSSKIIFVLVLIACVPQMAYAYLGRTPSLNYFYNSNIALEISLLYIFFKPYFLIGIYSKIFNLFGFVGLIVGIIYFLFFGIKDSFLTNWLCINNFIFTIWCLLFLLELYQNNQNKILFPISIFLYLFGIFFYTSCTMIIFTLWNYIMSNKNSLLNNLWIIHDVFNTLMYLLFGIGFILDSKKHELN